MAEARKKIPCAGKLAFDSQEAALAEARAIKWRQGTKLKTYKCRYCGLWHLSSQPDD